jgi:hypothetical protein
MNVKIVALGAAMAVAAVMPSPANARCNGCAVGAGVIGGLAAGAIIGSAIAGPRYAEPAPPPVYYAAPPEYVEGPVCHVERQRFWDGYGWRHRRVEVCD